MTFLLETVKLGLNNLRLHMLRSVLTALGIILGVTAVITMVSIGEGSKRQALDQLESLGARNIIVRSQQPPDAADGGGGRRAWASRYGITREDLVALRANFPDAEAIVPLKSVGSQLLNEERRITSQAFGTTPELRSVANLRVARGRYLTEADLAGREMVGVIGNEIADKLFPFTDPLGEMLRIDDKVITIVGVLTPVGLSGGAGAALVGRDMNLDVHIPITTAESVFGDLVVRRDGGSFQASEVQIQEVFIVSTGRDQVMNDAERARRLMTVRHPRLTDITLIVPYELLESARKSAMTWNLVLGFIAGISLVVGGIGIMNIMLASVTERTREIGIRRALGATRKHIVWQFLVETGVLSAIGGLVGIALGVGLSLIVEWTVPRLHQLPAVGIWFESDASLPTQLTMWSIFLSFGVAAATGLLFGIYPAIVAARQDPIVALRHD
ncbi:MAG: FtsX-like permease family protein [Phycisphaerales bacterium]|nr:MAG: FtsX-like permease family protein [Phycisphaerales bacterium]